MHSTNKGITFELTFSRTPPTLILDKRPIVVDEEAKAEPSLTRRWLNGLRKLVTNISQNMRKADKSFKDNFDKGLHRSKDILRAGRIVFIREEHFARDEEATTPKGHKLSPVAKGRYEGLVIQKSYHRHLIQ